MMLKCRIFPGITLCVLALACTALLSGCGSGNDGPPRYRVTGDIKYDDKPVPYGMIQFLPDSSKGNNGPAGYATIVNGHFDTDQAGSKGMVGGPHQVIITGMKEAPSGGTPNPDEPAENNQLFPQYTTIEDFPKGEATLNLAVAKPAL